MKYRMTSNSDRQHAPLRDGISQQHRGDADHGLDDPSQNQAIHQPAEIDGPKTAQECRRFSLVAQLHEFHVGKNSRAAPIAREKENRHHSRQTLRPPDPVPRNPVLGHHPGDKQRCVRGERGCHHGRACQPPGHISPGNEKLLGASRGAPPVIQADQQIQQQVRRDHNPIGRVESHL